MRHFYKLLTNPRLDICYTRLFYFYNINPINKPYQADFIEADILPKFASTSVGVQWFRNRGQWQDRNYTPTPGDIILFEWNGDGTPQHVGIVERVVGNTVCTDEGNSSDTVRR